MKERAYIAIDLKSFFASVECRERGLDPLDTNLVVADESRTDKTICLAITPTLKRCGLSSRGRLFEVRQRVREANALRQRSAPGRKLEGTSHFFSEPIRLWRWISSSRRREWRITWRTAAESIRFTSNTSRRRISWSIPSTRCSWMRRII